MSEQLKRQTPSAVGVKSQEASDVITIDLVDLFYRLIGSWKLIICIALVFALVAGVYTIYFVTPQYRAKSIIYVLSPDSILNVTSLQLGSALTSDYIKVFDMWEVHDEVLKNLGLNYSYTKIRKMLSVTNSTGTRMLDISVTSPSPKEAADIANEYAKVASNYIQETMSTDKPNIMSVALEPTNPISPNRARNIILGFIIGMLFAAAIVTFRFLMDDKLRTAEDIRQYTGLATLAVVPVEDEEMASSENKRKGRGKKK